MGCDDKDKVSLSYPWVMYDESVYKMWYGSTITRDAGNGEMLHVISNATSIDGIKWIPNGLAIPFEIGVAQAFSKPCIIKNKYYEGPLSYLPLNTNTKSVKVESDGYYTKEIELPREKLIQSYGSWLTSNMKLNQYSRK